MNKIGNCEFLRKYPLHSISNLLQEEVVHGKMRTRSKERLSKSPPETPKTTPPGQAEKATRPDTPRPRVIRTRSSGNGQAGEQSFESMSNSTIDLTSSPETPKTQQVKMKAALYSGA